MGQVGAKEPSAVLLGMTSLHVMCEWLVDSSLLQPEPFHRSDVGKVRM